ncbi:MAG TPA: helix-turn-helix domain-containing protein, partial [Thermoanaerobaculia bacterium]|nr:helix-turn-helix domain-containing protein [Thermoanaerobaculia bacterium]
DYDWPGNVRELENVLERALVLGPGVIDVEQLPDAVRQAVPRPSTLPPDGLSFQDAVEAYRRSLLTAALQRAGGVQKRAAELLRLKPTTLNEMLKRHGLLPKDRPEGGGPPR